MVKVCRMVRNGSANLDGHPVKDGSVDSKICTLAGIESFVGSHKPSNERSLGNGDCPGQISRGSSPLGRVIRRVENSKSWQ